MGFLSQASDLDGDFLLRLGSFKPAPSRFASTSPLDPSGLILDTDFYRSSSGYLPYLHSVPPYSLHKRSLKRGLELRSTARVRFFLAPLPDPSNLSHHPVSHYLIRKLIYPVAHGCLPSPDARHLPQASNITFVFEDQRALSLHPFCIA